MNPARLETAVWMLIYGGLVILMIGLWSFGSGGALAYGLAAGGMVLIVVGLLLLWLRSRLKDAPEGRGE